MKDYTAENIINISLVGHFGAGKTILADAMLFNTKAIRAIGSIDKGTSTSDYLHREVEHQHSISTSLLSYEYLDKKVNLLDSPGMFDFQGEMINSLFASDVVGFVINSINGLEVGTDLAASHLKNMICVNTALYLRKFYLELSLFLFSDYYSMHFLSYGKIGIGQPLEY